MSALLHTGVENAALATGLALVVLAATLVWRRPPVARALWLLVLLRLVVPPLVVLPWTVGREVPAAARPAAVPLGRPAGTRLVVLEPPVAPVSVRRAPPEPRPTIALPTVEVAEPAAPFPWRRLLGGIWLLGAAALLVGALVRSIRFGRFLGRAAPAPPWLEAEVASWARRLGVRSPPETRVTAARIGPLVFAGLLGRPRLLLPAGLLDRLDAGERGALLAHELAHVARRDHWIRRFQLVATSCFFWLPTAWWAARRLRDAEEACCDAQVAAVLPGREREYARTLLHTLDYLAGGGVRAPALASGLGSGRRMRRRFRMILENRTDATLGARRGVVLMLAGLLALVLTVRPAIGQEAGETEAGAAAKETVREAESSNPESSVAERLDRLERLTAELVAELRALRAADGPRVVRSQTLAAPSLGLWITIEDDGRIRRVDRETGRTLWTADLGEAPTGPGRMTDEGLLLRVGERVFTIDPESGKVLKVRERQSDSTSFEAGVSRPASARARAEALREEAARLEVEFRNRMSALETEMHRLRAEYEVQKADLERRILSLERASLDRPEEARTHTVRAGESLATIARDRLGSVARWKEILEANPGLDPATLRVGQVLRLPAPDPDRDR